MTTRKERPKGTWETWIPILLPNLPIVLFVLLVCGGLLTYLGSLVIYTGPVVPERDYAAEHRELALRSVGRDSASNTADWESYSRVISMVAIAFSGPSSSESNLVVPEAVPAADDETAAKASRILQAFGDVGGWERLDALVRIIEDRGPPVRVLEDPTLITIDSVNMRDNSEARKLARMLAYRARLHQFDGSWASAIEDLRALLAWSRVGQAQNTLIEWLVGVAIEMLLHDEIRHIATNLEIVGFDELAQLAAMDFTPPRTLASVLDGERLWVLGTFKEELGRTRIYPLSYSAQARVVDEYIDLSMRLAEGDGTAQAEADALLERVSRSWKYAPSSVMLPALSRCIQAESRIDRERELTALILAIERYRRVHGRVPELLSDLEDMPEHDVGIVYVTVESEVGYRLGHPDVPGSLADKPQSD